MDRSKQMGEGNVTRLLIKFSIPGIIGMLVNALYNIVDRIFVGRVVGSLGIAGITIGFPVMLVTMAFSMLVGMGATSLISIRLGEQKKEEAELITGNAIVLLILIAITFSALGLIFLDPLLKIFGASSAVLPYATQYLRIILLGTVLMSIGFGMNNFIRAEGNPRVAMYTMLIGAVANIILNYIFIFIFGLGIKGAAVATIISQGISSAWVLYYFLFGNSVLRIRRINLKLNPSIILKVLAVGFPMFAMQLVNSLQQAILNKSLSIYGGDLAISAMGIIFSIGTIIIMPVTGINQGAQPIIGYNYGARQYDRVKKTLKLAILAATSIALIGFLVIRLFPEQMIALFSKNDIELIKMGTHGLLTFFLLLPVVGFQIIGSNYFQAVGKPKQATILTLSRQALLFIPALLILPHFWGLEGIWRTAPVADLGSFVLTGICLLNELKNLDRQHNKKVLNGT